MSLDLSILIVTYQCRDETRDCLVSISDHPGSVSLEVVVVDNDSTDGTAEMVASDFSWAQLVALRENVGFAAAVNRAAEVARGEYLLLLNPDTVVHPGTIDAIVRFAHRNPTYGLYGGRTLDPDGTVHPGSCWGKPTLWSLFCFATMLSTVFKRSRFFDPESLGRWERDSIREVDIVTGCLLLVRQSLWRELGGFDERFFMYGEDADLALRAARLGLRHVITPDAVITHEIGVSSSTRSDKLVLLLRGKTTLLRTHLPAGTRRLGVGLLTVGVGIRALIGATVLRRDTTGRDASGWHKVWKARSSWSKGYPERRVAESSP